jgi:hypothetical protein
MNYNYLRKRSIIPTIAWIIFFVAIIFIIGQYVVLGFLAVKVANDPTETAQGLGSFIRTFLEAIKN